jgi:hypothetical protein
MTPTELLGVVRQEHDLGVGIMLLAGDSCSANREGVAYKQDRWLPARRSSWRRELPGG